MWVEKIKRRTRKMKTFEIFDGINYNVVSAENGADAVAQAGYASNVMLQVTEVEVPVMVVMDGVEVINICDLYDALRLWNEQNYTDEIKKVEGWCKANEASIYSEDREDFFLFLGVEKAKREGKARVVVEDLS
jgi:hypothetical protein